MKKLYLAAMLLLSLSIPFVSCEGANKQTNTNESTNKEASPKETVETEKAETPKTPAKEANVIPEETCKSILNRLYNDYVLGGKIDEFNQFVEEWFTAKAKQKLMDAYDYDCEGVCYAIWEFRTISQDGKDSGDSSQIYDIWHEAANVYEVFYSDMGWKGSTLFLFTEENGKVKIDDYVRRTDDSAEEYGPWGVDKQDVVLNDKGEFVGAYLFTDGDNYIVEVQEINEVPISGHRKVTYSAENGQGVVYTYRTKVNVRESPSTDSKVVALMPTTEDGMAPETVPCIGKAEGWFKIKIDGKVGYVKEDLVQWSCIDWF